MNNSQPPKHCPMPYFPVEEGQLLVGGQRIEQLAQQFDGKPFYAYDRAVIDQHIQSLRDVLPDQMSLHYAVKANPMPELVQYVSRQVDGLDIASKGELELALQTETDPRFISFTGPGKSEDELLAAISAGVILNIESEVEMQHVGALAERCGVRPRVTLRVNPDFELKSSGLRMGGTASQFGIDAEQIPELFKKMGNLDIEFFGFHIFAGSQILHADAIIDAQNKTLELATQLAKHAPSPVQLLNIGGGFGIPYFPGDEPLNIEAVAKNLKALCTRAARDLPEARLALELGRYLVGEAGVYVCQVIDKKVSRGQTFLITNGGMHHHLAASGNFGQVVRKNFPVVIGNKMSASEREVVNVVGRLCTPLDLLAANMELPKAGIGDLVVILQSGAYGRSASPEAFLSHPGAFEILV